MDIEELIDLSNDNIDVIFDKKEAEKLRKKQKEIEKKNKNRPIFRPKKELDPNFKKLFQKGDKNSRTAKN